MGLSSFGCYSGMSSLFRYSACICICSYGRRRFGVLIDLRRVMVFSMFPYSCLQFKICSAQAECGSLFFMYLVCSRNLAFRSRLVWPAQALWHVLHLISYIPLFSQSDIWFCDMVCMSCWFIVCALNAIPMFVSFEKKCNNNSIR